MKWFLTYKMTLVIAITFMFIGRPAFATTAYVPVRVSIKFILNSSGNRPATGSLNTDAKIMAEFDWANTILGDARNRSEFRLELVEFEDLNGVSTYYSSAADDANKDALRAAAIAAPGIYLWRTDAINIYINGGTGSAYGSFPPDNDIILMNQSCGNTPSCILHEVGHNLSLLHTHQTGDDGCSDTLADNKTWTKDQIALNAFGKNYASCTAAEQDQVDLVFSNVMSYHTSLPQVRLSVCQLDKVSTQGDSDRSWLLTRQPVYVDNSHSGTEDGRYETPYKTLEAAITAGLSDNVIVLKEGNHPEPTSVLEDSSFMVTRSGTSNVGFGCQLYSLPTDLEHSRNPQVSSAIRAVQSEDTTARIIMKKAKEAEKLAVTDPGDESPIMVNAKAAAKIHEDNAIGHLLDAEAAATGKEKVAILFELAQRYKYAGNCTEAIGYFILVADNTTQPYLRERALFEAKNCNEMLEMTWGQLDSKKSEDGDSEPAPNQSTEGEIVKKGPIKEKQLSPGDVVPGE